MSGRDDRTMEAVRAMRDRGIDGAESLLEYAEPERILNACRWWDGLTGVRPGLLVKRIKEGGVSEEQASVDGLTEKQRKLTGLRARFAEKAKAYPPGSVTERHGDVQRRRSRFELEDDELCTGDLVVIHNGGDVIEVRCDQCKEDVAYSLRSVSALPDAPLAVGRDEPSRASCPRPAASILLRRHENLDDDLRHPNLEEVVRRWHERPRAGDDRERPNLVEVAQPGRARAA